MAPLVPSAGLPQARLFRLGVVSDVQYADIEDGASYYGNPRFYRHSLKALNRAMMQWNQNNVQLGINLGDTIDGKSQRVCSETAMSDVLNTFQIFDGETHHVIGNHCLYNFDRSTLHEKLQIKSHVAGQSYYSLEICPKWKIVVVDGYDVSILGWDENHPHTKQAYEILEKNNPNDSKFETAGLTGPERRFVCYGGGLGNKQIEWLRQELETAKNQSQKVLMFGHIPFVQDERFPACLLWNYQEVLDIMHDSGVVVATFAGHAHDNSYQVDQCGVHHVVLPSLLETLPGNDCYGWIDIYENEIELVGFGEMDSIKFGSNLTQKVKELALV